jgi:hypothetical protein
VANGKLASLGGVSSYSVGAYGVGRVFKRGKLAWQTREAAEAP